MEHTGKGRTTEDSPSDKKRQLVEHDKGGVILTRFPVFLGHSEC